MSTPEEIQPENGDESAVTESEVIERLAGELEQTRDRWLRAAAEAENLRKRVRKDIETARGLERRHVLREILPVVDVLDRAVAMEAGAGDEAEGLDAIRSHLVDTLGRLGVEAFESVGQPFDPVRHEAIATVDAPGAADSTVLEVLQKGYLVDGEVLREARVVVVKRG